MVVVITSNDPSDAFIYHYETHFLQTASFFKFLNDITVSEICVKLLQNCKMCLFFIAISYCAFFIYVLEFFIVSGKGCARIDRDSERLSAGNCVVRWRLGGTVHLLE